jgi:hypothetical protein
MRDFFLKR